MGAPKQKWTSEEEDALRAGVAKHGTGKWKNIQKDPEFNHCLAARSNIDLKDKWRNMSVSASGQGSRDKLRVPKPKPLIAPPSSTSDNPSSSTQVAEDASTDVVMDSTVSVQDGKTPPRYNAMIFEALSSMKDPNGSETSAIISFIEERHEVPQNIKRVLSARLRRLVQQNKLEKTQNGYKMKKDITFGNRTPTPKQRDVQPRQPQNSGLSTSFETIEDAAVVAAYKIADAENKSFVAAEAVKEAERVAKMAEDTDSLLELARQIYERCSRGEIVLMA